MATVVERRKLRHNPSFGLLLVTRVPTGVLLTSHFGGFISNCSVNSGSLAVLVLNYSEGGSAMTSLFSRHGLTVGETVHRLVGITRESNGAMSVYKRTPSMCPSFARFLMGDNVSCMSIGPSVIGDAQLGMTHVRRHLVLSTTANENIISRRSCRL